MKEMENSVVPPSFVMPRLTIACFCGLNSQDEVGAAQLLASAHKQIPKGHVAISLYISSRYFIS